MLITGDNSHLKNEGKRTKLPYFQIRFRLFMMYLCISRVFHFSHSSVSMFDFRYISCFQSSLTLHFQFCIRFMLLLSPSQWFLYDFHCTKKKETNSKRKKKKRDSEKGRQIARDVQHHFRSYFKLKKKTKQLFVILSVCCVVRQVSVLPSGPTSC